MDRRRVLGIAPAVVALVLSLAGVGAGAATVEWVGPAAADWQVPAHWSTGTLPGPGDDVAAGMAANPVEITHTGGGTQIQSLTLNGTLHLAGGSLALSQASQISGELALSPGATLTVTGTAASLAVTGAADIDRGNLHALSGGRITLPGATRYAGPGELNAEGAGSRIELANLSGIGIGGPAPPDLLEAISRAVSVYRGRRDTPGDPAADLLETVSRAVSVYRGPKDGPGEPAEDLMETVSRAVSVYRGPKDGPGEPAEDLLETISRAVSVRRTGEPEM